MKKPKYWLVLWVYCILVVVGCVVGCNFDKLPKSEPDEGIFSNDFEQLSYWNNSGSLVRGAGKDGSACLVVDPEHPYSAGFTVSYGEVKKLKPRQVRVEGWFKVEQEQDSAKLVACVMKNNENLAWQGAATPTLLGKTRVWTRISVSVNIPANTPDDALIVVFGLNTGNGGVLFDDLSIRLSP